MCRSGAAVPIVLTNCYNSSEGNSSNLSTNSFVGRRTTQLTRKATGEKEGHESSPSWPAYALSQSFSHVSHEIGHVPLSPIAPYVPYSRTVLSCSLQSVTTTGQLTNTIAHIIHQLFHKNSNLWPLTLQTQLLTITHRWEYADTVNQLAHHTIAHYTIQ